MHGTSVKIKKKLDRVVFLYNKFDFNVIRASAVQHERGPRNSTLRRQMALFYKEPNSPPPADLAGALGVASVPPLLQPPPPHPSVLDLALPKVPRPEPPHPLLQTPAFFCSPAAIAATAALPKVKVYTCFVSCVDCTAPNSDVELRPVFSSSPATRQNQWDGFLCLQTSELISLP